MAGTLLRRPYAAHRPVGRVAVVVALLAGLFAMHGLSDHGTMRHDLMAEPTGAMSGAATPMTHARHAAPTPAAVAAAEEVATLVGAGSAGGPLSMAMGMCVAVMVGLGLALLLRSRPRPAVTARPALHRAHAGRPARARDPDPPDLVTLSVQRC